MIGFIMRRILQIIPVLLVVIILVFSMLHLIPGDPARLMVGIEASKETIEIARENLGLNKPLYQQFFGFLGNLLKGDLGTSIQTGTPVVEELANRLPITMTIAFGATLFAAIFGVLGGILAAIRQNKFLDDFIMVISLLAVSIPSYFLGLLLLLIFSLNL